VTFTLNMYSIAVMDRATFPLPRTCPFHPPAEYGRLRAEERVSRVRMVGGNQAWVVARHRDVRRVLSDRRMSADRRRDGFPRFAPATRQELQESFREFRPPLNWMDPPEHTAARRAVVGEFTVARVARMEPRIAAIVDRCLDAMLATPPPVDLHRMLSLPVPSRVICDLLGVPYDAHGQFEARATAMLSRGTPADERTRAAHGIRRFLDAVVSTKEREPGEDLLSRLIAAQRAGAGLDHEAVVSMAFVLLVAGHVTTSNMISLGVLALLEHPRQLALLVADPGRVPGAVEELLRYFTIVEAATARTAVEDLEVGGVAIRAGEGVVALCPAANRDPAVFDRPDELDIERDAREHLAFGFGRHTCLGQNLARLELRVVFERLFRRVPGLRLASTVDELSFKEDANIYGVHALPVTWAVNQPG